MLAPGQAPPTGHGAFLRLGHEMPADPLGYAAALYETLHRLDAQHLNWIAVEQPPDLPEWAGVLDRLRHACEKL
jgi:L-threonylcarbamoyladenylate synthase